MEQRPPARGPVVGFDLDMTLVDSAAGIAATLRAVLAEHGRTVSDAEVWPYVGVPMEATVEALHPDLDPVAVARRYRELYPDVGLAPIRLLPGAGESFDAVRGLGGRVLVVSAKIEPAVRRVLAHVGLDGADRAPDEVAGGLYAGAKGVVLRGAGADVYVGDHSGDMRAATVAGCVGVGVTTGPESADDLWAAGAHAVLPGLESFPAWLRRHVAEPASA